MLIYILMKKLVLWISTPIVAFLVKLGVIINDPRKIEIAVLIVLLALFGAFFNMMRVSRHRHRDEASLSANAMQATMTGFENLLGAFFVGLLVGVFIAIPFIIFKIIIPMQKYFNNVAFKKMDPALAFPLSLLITILIVGII